jgi:hypothetical protein
LALIGALLALGGPDYVTGLLTTTVARSPGGSSALLVLTDAWKWVGLVCVIAVLGLALCILRRKNRPQVMILAVLTISGALAPLNQARIDTLISLSKHVDFGAWFAAAAAGYAVTRLTCIGRRRTLHYAAAGIALVGVALPATMIGRSQAWTMFHAWPNSGNLVTELRSLTRQYPGHYLSEDYDVPSYYLESTTPWQYWSGTWYFGYKPPGSTRRLIDLPAYRAAFQHHYFSLVILDFEATPNTDRVIAADMRESGGYQVVGLLPSSVGQYTIWAYEGHEKSASQRGNS